MKVLKGFEDKKNSRDMRTRKVDHGDNIMFGNYHWLYKIPGIVVAIAVTFFAVQSLIQSIFYEYKAPSMINQTSKVYYYKDDSKSMNLTFEQISGDFAEKNFLKSEKDYFTTGLVDTAFWIKINPYTIMPTDVNGDSMSIMVTYPMGGALKVYFPIDETGGVYHEVTDYDENKHSIKNAQNPFKSVIVPGDLDITMPIYINIVTQYPTFSINTASFNELMTIQGAMMTFYMICMGIVVSIIVLNVFLAYFYRAKHLAYHAIYCTSAMILMAYYSGIFSYFIGIMEFRLPHFMAITLALFVLYMKHFLQERIRQQRKMVLNRIFDIIILSLIFISFVLFFNSSKYLVMAEVLYIVILIAWGVYIFLELGKDNPYSFYVVVSVILLALSGFILSGCTLGLLTSPYWMNLNFVFLALEPVLFTLGVLYSYREFDDLNRELYTTAVTDSLTGLYNRLYLDSITDDNISLLTKGDGGTSMLMYDIDHFKKVNDQYGHSIGDGVIKELVDVVSSELRKKDISFRWGGEEFLAVLPDTKISDAILLSEKIRKRVEDHRFEHVRKLTVSIGVVQIAPDEIFIEAFDRVDKALYKAKEKGRNRCYASFESHYRESMMDISLLDEVFIPVGNMVVDNNHREIVSVLEDMRHSKGFSGEELLRIMTIHGHNEVRILRFSSDEELDIIIEEHEKVQEEMKRALEDYENQIIKTEAELSCVLLSIIINHIISEDLIIFGGR